MSDQPREFTDVDLSRARFQRCDLSQAVMRGVIVDDLEIDAPWLTESMAPLVVNGVDVTAYVDDQLNQRFPGRDLRMADRPDTLRAAWAAVELAWEDALAHAATLPPTLLEESVAGEWSWSQTLRHLIMATDVWLRGAILGIADPYHPMGQPNVEYETDGYDLSVFSQPHPTYDDVRTVRAERQTMVREFIASVDAATLEELRPHPWGPGHHESVLHCLQTIIGEEWEHLRYALRDLNKAAASQGGLE